MGGIEDPNKDNLSESEEQFNDVPTLTADSLGDLKPRAERRYIRLPSAGVQVCIKELTGLAIEEYMDEILKRRKGSEKAVTSVRTLRSRLIALCAIDPKTGDTLFNPDDPDAVARRFTNQDFETLFRACQNLNKLGIKKQDIEEGKPGLPTTTDGEHGIPLPGLGE